MLTIHYEIEEYKNDIFDLKDISDLYDTIREIVHVFSEELPDLSKKLLWKNNCAYNDANITIVFLKKYLIDNDMLENIDLDMQRFWNRYKTWYDSDVYSYKYLKSEYLEEDINGYEPAPYIDYDYEYMISYGYNYPFSLEYEIYDFQQVISFIEIVYNRWINIDKRYEYTIYVNQLFSQSNLPYQLKSGKVIFKGYISSDDYDKIINKKMFEEKLDQSRKLIMSNEKHDKKLALKLIVDCLEYLESIQPGKSQRVKLAESVSDNPKSKLIVTLKNDLNSLFTMTNDYFDIRHNKENTNQGDKREVIDNIADIEYIYNRIYATVQLLAIKEKEKRNEKNK
ncbi:MAG: hypothetical protein ACLRT4_02790 [Thomasclavelia sp.]